MLYLLNAINSQKQTFWLLFCLGLLLIIEISAYAVFLVFNSKRTQSDQRNIVGIKLNTKNVQRKFTVGDDFACNDLNVRAIYNLDPTSVNLDYVVVTEEQFEEIKSQGEMEDCYVVMPDMYTAGKKSVAVYYHDITARFSISVVKPAPEASADDVEQPVEKPVLKLIEKTKAKLFQIWGAIKSAFVNILSRDRLPQEPNSERILMSLSLDTVIVKRKFGLNEPFSCTGLVVYANYNVAPTHESIVDYKILNQTQFNHLKAAAESTLYIIKPDMSEIGEKTVNVVYGGMTESYTIEVVEPNSVEPTSTEK